MKGRYIVGIISVVVILFILSIFSGIYSEYGGHNVKLAIVRYINKNGQMPSSWEDIEKFHSDPLISCKSTVMVQIFWKVNWDVDMVALYKESEEYNESEEYIPIVYNKSRYPAAAETDKWKLNAEIHNCIKENDYILE